MQVSLQIVNLLWVKIVKSKCQISVDQSSQSSKIDMVKNCQIDIVKNCQIDMVKIVKLKWVKIVKSKQVKMSHYHWSN